jgi:hypothetical protein
MDDTIMEDVLELPLLPTMELFTEVTQEQECDGNDPSVHSNFRLQTKYNDLREVWNQRYGIDQHGGMSMVEVVAVMIHLEPSGESIWISNTTLA